MAPYSVLTACELISQISRWGEFSKSTPKSGAESHSKMMTNMASKFFKFVYGGRCMDRLPTYYHTYLQSLALFVEQTQKPRFESGCDSPTSLVV